MQDHTTYLTYTSNADLQELGEAVAARRRKLGLKQGVVALQAGVGLIAWLS